MKILDLLTIIEEEHNRTQRDIEIIKQAKQEIERLNKELTHKTEQYEFIRHGESKEIERLNNKIDKAIKYMKNYIKVETLNEPVKVEFKEVINILKGSDKE